MIRARAAVVAILVAVALVMGGASGAAAHTIAGIVPDLGTAGGQHLAYATEARSPGLEYEGGPVLHANRTHLVFWQPAGSGLRYDTGYQALAERFLTGVAADSHSTGNVYSLSGQYYDSGGPAAYASTYGGAVTATDPLPANGCAEPPATGPGWTVCLTDIQLQQELSRVVTAARLPRGGSDIYFLVLPAGLGTCTDGSSSSCALGGSDSGYCGYHSQTLDGLLYAVIPYNAVSGHCQSDNPRPNGNPVDPALSTISHEHNESVTDPETYGAWIDPSGDEEADLCITEFGSKLGGAGADSYDEVIGGGRYYLQEEWSNAIGRCAPRAEPDHATIHLATRVVRGRPVTLAAHAGDPEGQIVGYRWSFGDGTYSHRRVIGHTYRRAGSYRITLRVTDNWDNWTTTSRVIRVPAASARERRRG